MANEDTNLSAPRPNGWSQPKLTMFFENMWGNAIATFANKKEAHRLCRIDDLMFEISWDWKGHTPNVETIVPLMMFFRAHSAFRAACSLGMSGMTVEGMAVLRLCLEFAAYACFLNENPRLAQVWWDRDLSKDNVQKMRDEFTAGKVKRAVKSIDERLGDIYEQLYDRTIQWGGHPNEKTVTQGLALIEKPGETELQQIYLQGDGRVITHWIHTGNQIGICVLKIFEHVHHARFEKLNVKERIAVLAKGV
jgi:hypothetical protein